MIAGAEDHFATDYAKDAPTDLRYQSKAGVAAAPIRLSKPIQVLTHPDTTAHNLVDEHALTTGSVFAEKCN